MTGYRIAIVHAINADRKKALNKRSPIKTDRQIP